MHLGVYLLVSMIFEYRADVQEKDSQTQYMRALVLGKLFRNSSSSLGDLRVLKAFTKVEKVRWEQSVGTSWRWRP